MNKGFVVNDLYREVLRSARWRKLRFRLIRACGSICQRCSSYCASPELHHRHYRNLGKKLDEDLQVLCGECHIVADYEREEEVEERRCDREQERWGNRVSGYIASQRARGSNASDDELENDLEEWLEDIGDL